jgi:hypothetical protein
LRQEVGLVGFPNYTKHGSQSQHTGTIIKEKLYFSRQSAQLFGENKITVSFLEQSSNPHHYSANPPSKLYQSIVVRI